MAFELRKLVPKVDHAVLADFVSKYGAPADVPWSGETTQIAATIQSALDAQPWAWSALTYCELIPAHGGRELLRTAGHYNSKLMNGVDNPEWTDETCSIWLATHDPSLFDHIVSAAHALKGLGTKSWEAFTVDGLIDLAVAVDDEERMSRFRDEAREFLHRQTRVPAFGKLVVDSYRHRTSRSHTHSLHPWIQVNVYAELSPEAREVVTSPNTVGAVQLPRTYRASILCEPEKRTIEVVAKGGQPVRDGLVALFCKHLLPPDVSAQKLVSRCIDFSLFRKEPDFELHTDDGVSSVVVDEVRLLPPSAEAGLVTIERKRKHGKPASVYQSAEEWFGGQSPIGRAGWEFVGVRLRLTFKADEVTHKQRVRTIELRSPRGTSLREKSDADHAVAEKLFRRWGIFLEEDAGDDESD
ncbi:MAG: hypothetical protein AAF732_12145 [Pseudomonadota bacterium]